MSNEKEIHIENEAWNLLKVATVNYYMSLTGTIIVKDYNV